MKSNDERTSKIGEGHAAAMGRLGLRELRGGEYPASNVAQQSEYGLYGTMTPGEVAEARRETIATWKTSRGRIRSCTRNCSGLTARDDRGQEKGRDLDR